MRQMISKQFIVLLMASAFGAVTLQAQNPEEALPQDKIDGVSLTLEECYSLSEANYPLVKQYELISKSKEYSIENAQKAYLPQVGIYGQVSYQSDVTKIPISIPGIAIPELPKNQYKVYGEVTYSFTDLITTKNQKDMIEADAEVQAQRVRVELYNLRDRINAIFFGILLIDAQIEQNLLVQKDISTGIGRVEVSIANGTALKSTADNLKAELLKTKQQATELRSTRRAYADMLSLFIGRKIDEGVFLVKPMQVVVPQTITRPELAMYEMEVKAIDLKNRQVTNMNIPRLNFFFQGGMGHPALNILSDKLDPYYIAGLRLTWNLSGYYTSKNRKRQIANTQSSTQVQQEAFLFNTNLTLSRQNAEIAKMHELTADDDAIIDLRESVKNTVQTQLDNGTATTNDYIIAVNAEDQARKNRILHEIQLLLAQYNARTTTGSGN